MAGVDFSYEVSDERLLAYDRMPILDRLRWLDDILQFTLMVRAAPDVRMDGSGDESLNGRIASDFGKASD